MSSKFSRRSTRVQHKPHVCISTPEGPRRVPVFPTEIDIGGDWQIDWPVDPTQIATNHSGAITCLQQATPNEYAATITDDQGNAVDVAVTVNAAPAQCAILITPHTFLMGDTPMAAATSGWNLQPFWLSETQDLIFATSDVGDTYVQIDET